MNIFIVLFILLINIINVFAMYKLLGKNMGKKEKVIFIAVGVAIMYMLVSAVYWLSSLGMDQRAADAGRDFITFTFVPVNSLFVLTFLSSSYKKYKDGRLKLKILRNRGIVLVAVLIILLIIEFFYFKNIQNNALEILNNNITNTTNGNNAVENSVQNNTVEENTVQNNAVEENAVQENNTVQNSTEQNSVQENETIEAQNVEKENVTETTVKSANEA